MLMPTWSWMLQQRSSEQLQEHWDVSQDTLAQRMYLTRFSRISVWASSQPQITR